MARSDAAKRAARLASKTNGQKKGKQPRNWLFPLSIVAVLAIGLGIVAFARNERAEKDPYVGGNDEHPIAQLTADSTGFDHWHAAFSVYVCGTELPNLNDVQDDLLGIHTHGDGLIHIHPFSLQTSGRRATMARYFDQVGVDVSGDTIRLPMEFRGGDTFVSGESTCAGKPAEWVLAHWKDATSAATKSKPDQVFTEDFGDIRFTEDLGAYTLAFVPLSEVDDIPAPHAAKDISILGQCDGPNPPAECEQLLAQQNAATTVPATSAPASSAPATTAPASSAPASSAPSSSAPPEGGE